MPGRRASLVAWPAAALLIVGCAAGGTAEGRPEVSGAPSETTPRPTSPTTSPTVGQRIDEIVEVVLGGVPLRLEVADDPDERAVGLMGRTEAPPGTGMVFQFGEPVRRQFWMRNVPIPLVGVFTRDGEVVHVAQMAPCAEADSARCPRYGPGEPFDTVVETAPETLPDIRPGDRLVYR